MLQPTDTLALSAESQPAKQTGPTEQAAPQEMVEFPARFTGNVSRVVLALLLTANLLFICFGDQLVDPVDRPWVVSIMLPTTIIAQPVLIAVWTALAPVGLIRRVASSIAVCVMTFVLRDVVTDVQGVSWEWDAVGAIITYCVGIQLAYWYCYARGWRITRRYQPEPSVTARSQFSLRVLFLLVTAGACVVGVVRWFVITTSSHQQSFLSYDLLLFVIAFVAGWLCSPVIGVALASRDRLRFVGLMLLSASVPLAIVAGLMAWQGSSYRDLVDIGSFLAAVVVNLLANLLVVRACGYRLIRTSRRFGMAVAEGAAIETFSSPQLPRSASPVLPA